MKTVKKISRVLIVSTSDSTYGFIAELLSPAGFKPVVRAKTAGEAKRHMLSMDFDIIIINTPLSDEFGIDLAYDAIEGSRGVMLLVSANQFEDVSAKVEEYGILTVQKPNSRQAVYGAIKLLAATNLRLSKLEKKNLTLQEKMNDIRTVNRAKWLLIENLNMSEKDAHYYIERQSMDLRISRREIAETIIRTYDK